jgi:restriction system protein
MTAQKAQRATVVTSGTFTEEARNFATGKPIDLIEGPQLAELVRTVQGSPAPTSAHAQRHAPVTPPASPRSSTPSTKASDQAKPPTPPTAGVTKTCPKCGAAMVLRTAKHGPSVGQQFWGCSQFPRCRATLSTQ